MTTTFGKLTVPVPKSTLGPQDIPKYLEQCEQHLLTATVPHIAEALKAPEAFEDTAWDKTPASDDHALAFLALAAEGCRWYRVQGCSVRGAAHCVLIQ